MRRLHLFEIEDLAACPRWLRAMITDMLTQIHHWFDTRSIIEQHLSPLLAKDCPNLVVDLCSGSGGPMIEVVRQLRDQGSSAGNPGTESIPRSIALRLTDLYPNPEVTAAVNSMDAPWLHFETDAVDATQVERIAGESHAEVRTMICSFHHLPPMKARQILQRAQEARTPILIFEMTDSSVPPKWLWWIALLPNFLFGLCVAAFTRPLTLFRILFSFLIPVIPICFAWDGAVSNIRTYNESDFRKLLAPIADDRYQWKVESVAGRMMNHLMITGRPT